MPESNLGEPPRAPTKSVLRLTFALAGVVAFVCGYVGLHQHLSSSTEYGHTPFDLFYYDLQLFVLGAPPLDGGGPFPRCWTSPGSRRRPSPRTPWWKPAGCCSPPNCGGCGTGTRAGT